MGGFNYGSINGIAVEYGDICEAEVWASRDEIRVVPCAFVETTDDGDLCFRCLLEEDAALCGGHFFNYYAMVNDVRFVCKPDDSRFFVGDGI